MAEIVLVVLNIQNLLQFVLIGISPKALWLKYFEKVT